MPKTRFGLTLSNRGILLGLATPESILELAKSADCSGAFEHIWIGDQIMAKPRMESIVLMSALAVRTRNVKIGVACMASLPSRNPIVLAYQWASLDLLSNGRMIMVACAGVPATKNLARYELDNMGVQSKERAARMEEHIEIMRRLWTEDRVAFQGRFHTLRDAFVEPKPVQKPPPVWVAGDPHMGSEKSHVVGRIMHRVARYGDGWMTTARPPTKFAMLREQVFKYAPEYEKDFRGLPCALYYNLNVNDDREAAIAESKRYLDMYYEPTVYSRDAVTGWVACGSPEQCAEQLQTFVEAGATDILLRFPSWDQKGQFKRCVEEVLPKFL